MTTDPATDTTTTFQVRAELYAPSRFPPRAFELFRTRALATDVIAQQCWLHVLAVARLHAALGGPIPHVGILGGGHVGCAVAMALLTHDYPPHKILLSTRQPDRVPKCDALASSTSQTLFQAIVRVYDNARLSRESDVLLLCVPPSQLKSVAIQLKHALAVTASTCVVVSVLCGTTAETLQKALGTRLVLRVHVDVPSLGRRLQRSEEDQENATEEHEPQAREDPLLGLRQRAEPLAAEQLATQCEREGEWRASPLVGVLTELARRLDTTLSPSQATETVGAVLLPTPNDATTTHAIDDTQDALAQEPTDGDTRPEGAAPDEEEPRWHASWTKSLEQLQQAITMVVAHEVLE